MTKLSRDLSAGILHPRENLFIVGTLGVNGAEVQADCDGCTTVAVDLRGARSDLAFCETANGIAEGVDVFREGERAH